MPEEIMSDKIILKYIGNASLIEIPARDLTEDDLKNIAWTGWSEEKLIESGLYEYVPEEDVVRHSKGIVVSKSEAPDLIIDEEPKKKRGK
jgi:hypothetical protein